MPGLYIRCVKTRLNDGGLKCKMDNNQKALSHFGILGMKWGVRRSEKQLSTSRQEAKTIAKEIQKNSGKSKSASQISRSSEEAIRLVQKSPEFLTYKKEAAAQWAKYLKESDEADGLYDKTLSKIHKDLKFKEDLKKIEADVISDFGKDTRDYRKMMEYARDSLESEHPLMGEYRTKALSATKSLKEATESSKKVAESIVKGYGNQKVENAQFNDMKVKNVVENIIGSGMMSDYYMSKNYKP